MIKKQFNRLNDWLEDCLRSLLGRMTPDRRVILIVSMFVLFSGLSIYTTVSAIYRCGRKEGERLHIERIEALELRHERDRGDSLENQINISEYGK